MGHTMSKKYERYTSLYCLSDQVKFKLLDCLNDTWNPEDYYLVRRIPTKEMTGKTEIALAEEFAQITLTGDWVKAMRRSIRIGDIISVGTTPWLFALSASIGIIENNTDEDTEIIRLNMWPDIILVKLTGERADKLCQVSV